jgi:hypothetical protein
MFDATQRATLRAASMGPFATQALHDGARGRVHSVFQRSAYLSIEGRLICLGSPALGDGPLNLICRPWPREKATLAGMEVGEPVCIERWLLLVGHSVAVSLAGAEAWTPGPAKQWDQARLELGLAALARALPEALPEEGLAALLRAGGGGLGDVPQEMAVRRAAVGVGRLVAKAMAEGTYKGGTEPVARLIGLGPGLTPSGDDFLAGVLVALSILDRSALRDSLWQAVQPLVAALTTDISGAHLTAAAAGFGSAALHDLLNAVSAGDTSSIRGHLEAVAGIGHTSGFDGLAGAVIVLRAASRPEQCGPTQPSSR